jgi:broad-specificity NMP kinase
MQTVFLYGPPGVGKLTVGQELAAQTGFKLVHNHLSVDLVSALFPFQSEPWGRLLHQVKRDVYVAAVGEGVDIIITGVYAGTPAAIDEWRTMLQPIWDGGGVVLSVQLMCERYELFRRLQAESRRVYGKLTDPRVLAERMQQVDVFAPLPFVPHMAIDTTSRTPAEVAAVIAEHFDLGDSASGLAR